MGVMIVIAIGNLLFIDYIWLRDRDRINQSTERLNQLTQAFTSLGGIIEGMTDGSSDLLMPVDEDSGTVRSDTCGPICQRVIEQQVALAIGSLTPAVSRTPTPASSGGGATVTVSKAGTYYIPLSGTGSTKNLDWTNIVTTETVIDWSEYGEARTVTWDAYAKIYQGNGKVSLRLYDKTNGIAVPNSELETGSETSVHLVSGQLAMWSGQNTYVVQVKSNTGYEAFFESGRIKVVVK